MLIVSAIHTHTTAIAVVARPSSSMHNDQEAKQGMIEIIIQCVVHFVYLYDAQELRQTV